MMDFLLLLSSLEGVVVIVSYSTFVLDVKSQWTDGVPVKNGGGTINLSNS